MLHFGQPTVKTQCDVYSTNRRHDTVHLSQGPSGGANWGANSPLGGLCVNALRLAMGVGNLAQAKTMVAHRTLLY